MAARTAARAISRAYRLALPQPFGGAARTRTTGPGDFQFGSGLPGLGQLEVWGGTGASGAAKLAC